MAERAHGSGAPEPDVDAGEPAAPTHLATRSATAAGGATADLADPEDVTAVPSTVSLGGIPQPAHALTAGVALADRIVTRRRAPRELPEQRLALGWSLRMLRL